MITSLAPYCLSCIHLTSEGAGLSSEAFRCDAFPDGVPMKILTWDADHREPIAGDDGIQFEQDPAAAEPPFDLLESD